MPGTSYVGGDTTNYILGRGIVYFDGDSPVQYRKGLRDLGNANEFTITLESETKEHQSFLEGLKVIDQSLVLSQKMTISFTLEEANANNMALFFLGTEKGLNATGVALPNMAGLASDNATYIDAGERNVWLTNIGLYLWYNLEITLNAGTATVLGGAAWRAYDLDSTQVASNTNEIQKNPTTRVATDGTNLRERTASFPTGDYELDRKMGRIRFFPAGPGSVGPTNNIKVRWGAPAVAKSGTAGLDDLLSRVETLSKSGVKGAVVFILENANTGHKYELRFHQVNLRPDGDFAGIGEEVVGMKLQGVCESVTISPYNGSKYADIVTRSAFST